jgi:Xaa-Pro aminopeptidase
MSQTRKPLLPAPVHHRNSAANPLTRIKRFQKQLANLGLDGYIVSKKENIQYLTLLNQIHPTHREAFLFINRSTHLLYHSPFLSPAPLINSLPISPTNPLTTPLNTICSTTTTVGYEATDLTVSEFQKIESLLENKTLVSAEIIDDMRLIKDALEMKYLIRSAGIITQVFRKISRFLSTNKVVTEKELAYRLNQLILKQGADDLAFPTIVAFDEHSAMPHHQPSTKKLRQNSVVLIDAGCRVNGYCSDMTRTYKLGEPDDLFTRVESTVLTAYQHALKTLKSGVRASEVDLAARRLIAQAGFGDLFIHTTGHALGLEIHEPPSLNSHNRQLLQTGMVVTIEPGIYLPGKFGYRHENTLAVSESGVNSLTS